MSGLHHCGPEEEHTPDPTKRRKFHARRCPGCKERDDAIVKLEHRVEVEHDRAEDLLKDFNHATKMRERAEDALEETRAAYRRRDAECAELVTRLRSEKELAEKARAATIEVLNDCQAEMGRQCARAEKAEWQRDRAAEKWRDWVEDGGWRSPKTLEHYIAYLDRRWKEHLHNVGHIHRDGEHGA